MRKKGSLLHKWLIGALDPAKVHEVIFRPLRRFRPVRRVALATDCKVSVLLVTNRPHQLDHAVRSYDAQLYPNTELVVVTNGGDFNVEAIDALRARADVICLTTEADVSLGEALNLAVTSSSGGVIAKFDDDDHYAPRYLDDAVLCMRSTGAAIIGKKTYYVYLESFDRTVRIYPGNEGRRVGRVAGGTIVAHRDVLDRVKFPAVDLGEDVRFVRAAERRGFGVYGCAAEGFLQCRAAIGNTWQIDPHHLVEVSEDVGTGYDPTLWSTSD